MNQSADFSLAASWGHACQAQNWQCGLTRGPEGVGVVLAGAEALAQVEQALEGVDLLAHGNQILGRHLAAGRPGMVAVVQTAGDLGNWRPHVHALVSRGVWSAEQEWLPVAFVDEDATGAERKEFPIPEMVHVILLFGVGLLHTWFPRVADSKEVTGRCSR